ncbi:MAG: hypothetical protein BWX45_00316 [Deltaproteobacteria bacterium ADurb.Bin002]|nr:MAG: hypothetical protein BWX45_00316 [Deltaproteobacteria bacterium ADurb.Bin002]
MDVVTVQTLSLMKTVHLPPSGPPRSKPKEASRPSASFALKRGTMVANMSARYSLVVISFLGMTNLRKSLPVFPKAPISPSTLNFPLMKALVASTLPVLTPTKVSPSADMVDTHPASVSVFSSNIVLFVTVSLHLPSSAMSYPKTASTSLAPSGRKRSFIVLNISSTFTPQYSAMIVLLPVKFLFEHCHHRPHGAAKP